MACDIGEADGPVNDFQKRDAPESAYLAASWLKRYLNTAYELSR